VCGLEEIVIIIMKLDWFCDWCLVDETKDNT